MRKILLSLFFLSFILHGSFYAQGKKYSSHFMQLQIETFGPGSLLSVNLDSRFFNKGNGIGFRIGLGATPQGIIGKSCNGGTILTVPAGLNYLIGKGNHLFEAGGGGVLAMVSGTKLFCLNFKSGFFSDETESYTYLLAGYRYQSVKEKTTYRLFISPLFQKRFPVKFWGGASIGIRL